MKVANAFICSFIIFAVANLHVMRGSCQVQILEQDVRHVRNTGASEWSKFPERADPELRLTFLTEAGITGQTLEITHTDVKLEWHVMVNGVDIGKLLQDEKRTTSYYTIPASALKAGDNVLTIHSDDQVPDDILVSDIRLYRGAPDNLMTAAVDFSIEGDDGSIVPGRITLINDRRSLQPMLASNDKNLAVRPGCIYTASAVAVRLPAGNYVAYATRGFEYGVDSLAFTIHPGDHIKHRFVVRREVDTKGWIASDTHVHTFTWSRHGDASLRERVLTLAGEGIELPVMTDHNVNVDLRPVLDSVVQDHPNVQMTPVIGDELTTAVGHFNVLNIAAEGKVIDHRGLSWSQVAKAIAADGASKVIVLNHARDIHHNFRPFDPHRHISKAGIDRDGWRVPANAMEVINSGSQQSDFILLFQDWMGMLNAGFRLTPIGSSDSHDVNRFIVGQGRTYVKGDDAQRGNINIGDAMRAIARGEVMVSCGLLANITVNKTYGPGALAKGARRIDVKVDVSGPAWSHAETVALYMNGVKIREVEVLSKPGAPILQAFSWDVDLPAHDVYFAAIAQGRIGEMPFWPIAKPYQPASRNWTPRVYAGTGAVWVDVNGNNRAECAADYAGRLYNQNKENANRLVSKLASYDEAVAAQTAALLFRAGEDLQSEKWQAMLAHAPDHVQRGFATVGMGVQLWRK